MHLKRIKRVLRILSSLPNKNFNESLLALRDLKGTTHQGFFLAKSFNFNFPLEKKLIFFRKNGLKAFFLAAKKKAWVFCQAFINLFRKKIETN